MKIFHSPTQYIAIFILVSGALSFVVAIIAATHRQDPSWRYFAVTATLIGIWCISDAAFYLRDVNDTEQWFWMIASYCVQIGCVPVVFAFALYYAGWDHWLTPNVLLLLWAPFLVAIVLAITNPWHSLIWNAALPPLAFHGGDGYGPYFFVMLPLGYGLMLLTVAILVHSIWRLHRHYQYQVILFVVAILLPLAGSMLYFTSLNPWPGVDLAPAAHAITGVLLYLSLTRLQVIKLRPVYRDATFKHMSEGAVILDSRGRIIDINPAAQHFLAATGRSVGDDCQAALAGSFALDAALDLSPGAQHLLVTREQPPRHFDLSVSAVGRQSAALLLVWRDTTPLRLALATIDAQDRYLAARAEAEADLGREIDGSVATLKAQVQAALGYLDLGQFDAAAALLVQMDTVTGENLRRRTQLFQEAGAQSTNFLAAIRAYITLFAETHGLVYNIAIDADLDSGQLAPAARLQAVRILQEALENVGRHARAQRIAATLAQTPDGIALTVRDDGVGFDPAHRLSTQTGIATMNRRAGLIGGNLTITSAPGAGAEVIAVFPPAVSTPHLDALRDLRVLLAVEHPLEREGLHSILTDSGLAVVMPALDAPALMAAVQAEQPALVLLDIDLPYAAAPDTIYQLRTICPGARIVYLAEEGHLHLPTILHSECDGYLLKSLPASVFVDTLAQITSGDIMLAPRLSTQIVAEFKQQDVRPAHDRLLTLRQLEILRLIGQGFTYQEIAAQLEITPRTVRYHIDEIRQRLGLANRNALAVYARRHHLSDSP